MVVDIVECAAAADAANVGDVAAAAAGGCKAVNFADVVVVASAEADFGVEVGTEVENSGVDKVSGERGAVTVIE